MHTGFTERHNLGFLGVYLCLYHININMERTGSKTTTKIVDDIGLVVL